MAMRKRRTLKLKPKTKAEPQVEFEDVEPVEEKKVVSNTKPKKSEVDEMLECVNQLSVIKQEKKTLEAREKELTDKLKGFTNKYGVQNDKGSYNYSLDNFILTNTARVVSKLNQDKAVDTFTKLGVLGDVSEIKTIVNEDLVEQAILNEKVPKEILDEIMDVKTNYAFTMKQVEEEVGENA